MKNLIVLLILCFAASVICVAQFSAPFFGTPAGGSLFNPTYVSSTGCSSSPCTITSTGAGHTIILAITAKSVSSAEVGSQSASFYESSSAQTDGYSAFLYYVTAATGGQTTATVSGTGSISLAEFEFSRTNTTSLWDAYGISAGGSGCSSTCAASVSPATSNPEGIIVTFVCHGSASTISSSGASFLHLTSTSGNPTGEQTVASTSTLTATVASGCGNSTSNGATGIIAAFY